MQITSAFRQRDTYLNVTKKLAGLPRILENDPILAAKLEEAGLDVEGLLLALNKALKMRSELIALYDTDKT